MTWYSCAHSNSTECQNVVLSASLDQIFASLQYCRELYGIVILGLLSCVECTMVTLSKSSGAAQKRKAIYIEHCWGYVRVISDIESKWAGRYLTQILTIWLAKHKSVSTFASCNSATPWYNSMLQAAFESGLLFAKDGTDRELAMQTAMSSWTLLDGLIIEAIVLVLHGRRNGRWVCDRIQGALSESWYYQS